MKTINVSLPGRSYPVMVGPGIIADPDTWEAVLPDAPIIILSNEIVAPIYLDEVVSGLDGRQHELLVIPDGEAEKSIQNWSRASDFLAEHRAGRDTCLVALGGGVVGDLCGFVAATWMRGIRFIQVPTTLLAQVDASVGGKTAINHAAGKNLVGAFHQPTAVIADTQTLNTLPEREYQAGLAEVVKYGAICDDDFTLYLESKISELQSKDSICMQNIICKSVEYKADIVSRDELESGIRAILNFGHTFAHALETRTEYKTYLHGEAVAVGMVVAAHLSEIRGLCPTGISQRLRVLLQELGLPVTIPSEISSEDILELMQLDKKNLSGQRRLILLKNPGEALVDSNSTDSEIKEALAACR